MCPSGAVLHGWDRVWTVSIDLRPGCRRFHFHNKIIIIIIYAVKIPRIKGLIQKEYLGVTGQGIITLGWA